MTDANLKQTALQNLRAFQEMSYSDVYSLIRQQRFDEAQGKYAGVLENTECRFFDAALSLEITTPHDHLLECMSGMASSAAEPEKIKAVSFDLSAHTIHEVEAGVWQQGIEVSLYSQDVYDFENASDENLTDQCEKTASDWQGNFLDVESVNFTGLAGIVTQLRTYISSDEYNYDGILETQQGNVIVDPNAIAYHIAKLLVAIEYHRYMADFVAEVEVPAQMIFIIGEHDEIEVPIVFYRVGAEESAEQNIEPAVEVETQETAQLQIEYEETTPPIYDTSHETKEESHEAEVAIVPEEPEEIGSDIGKKLYATAKAQSEVPKMISAKSLIGLPLEPRAFGKLSNKAHKDNFVES